MAERSGPHIYSIAAHRGFADALVAGLVPRYAQDELGLARLTLLLPSRRAIRTLTEAFIRHSGQGLLMPRMVVVGDLDLDETLGPLLDNLGTSDIPPAVDPMRRWLRLAEIIGEEVPGLSAAARLRRARELAATMDRLLVEDIGPEQLLGERVIGLLGDLASHWQDSLHLFARVQAKWLAELQAGNELDAAARRNRLFDHAAKEWKANPPATPLIAAGVTSAAPALARLLRVVSELPAGGAVILPDLDLQMAQSVWDELGSAGAPSDDEGEVFGRNDAVTHPQYHLKLLLNRMGVSRQEVQPWHRAGLGKGPPARSKAISNLFLPPQASKAWAGLDADERRLSGVRLMTSANPESEAQAIALLVREALEKPEKRVSVVTPDRNLASRVIAHLRRWNIMADDSAGRALPLTAAARVLLLLAQVMAEKAAPVPLMALLEHPLVRAGEERAAWLENARKLDLALRGPRPATGLDQIGKHLAEVSRRDTEFASWWDGVVAILSPLMALANEEAISLSGSLDRLVEAGETLCGPGLWSREDGRALSQLIEDLRLHSGLVGSMASPADILPILRDVMDTVAVRPPFGGHPRVAVYGLLESRMTRAELIICGGLNEDVWPAAPAPDPLLAPAILRALGVPGGDFRIGLSAHDLAGALGAPEVVLSRSERNGDSPSIPSRFLTRMEALLGESLANDHREMEAVLLAARVDAAAPAPAYRQPKPMPDAQQRKVDVSVTGLDQLVGDPFQFYASNILRLRRLDGLDSDLTPQWKGQVAHEILDRWHKQRKTRPDAPIEPVAWQVLDETNTHPLARGLWGPRLLEALKWVEAEVDSLEDRSVAATEISGTMEVLGVKIRGRADRIDRFANGDLAIVDYKTGSPPSGTKVEAGFAMQLGVLGLMAENGGFEGVQGVPTHFEYWGLGKQNDSFGYRTERVKEGRRKSGLVREEYLEATEDFLQTALSRWIVGDEPFTARLNPDFDGYTDYDQLMRLDEWQARSVSTGESGP